MKTKLIRFRDRLRGFEFQTNGLVATIAAVVLVGSGVGIGAATEPEPEVVTQTQTRTVTETVEVPGPTETVEVTPEACERAMVEAQTYISGVADGKTYDELLPIENRFAVQYIECIDA